MFVLPGNFIRYILKVGFDMEYMVHSKFISDLTLMYQLSLLLLLLLLFYNILIFIT
jgi:hypothetical protein